MTKVRIAILMIAVFLIVAICPLFLELVIYRNGFESVLTNGEWSSFLGSYIGGVVGGIGTIAAVLFSINETRRIQKRNESLRDNDKTVADGLRNTENFEAEQLRLNEKADYERYRNEDKLVAEEIRKAEQLYIEKKERRIFAYDIVEYVGKYITYISVYFYSSLSAERDNNELITRKDVLKKNEIEITQIYEQLRETGRLSAEVRVQTEIKQSGLLFENNILQKKVDEMRSEILNHKADRTYANECYFILKMKLKDINYSYDILEQLNYIHKDLFYKDLDWIEIQSKKLITITEEFTYNYVQDINSK